MKILVIADTHIPDFAASLPAGLAGPLRRCDLILHAGDVTRVEVLEDLAGHAPVRVAMGNNDRPEVAAWGAEREVHVEAAGVAIAMVHDSGPRPGRERRLANRFPDARLLIFGHSHIPVDERVGRQRLFNPGSPTWKRREPAPTYGWVTVTGGRMRTRIVPLD
ncbi:MAG: metallophosphoesterase family protein [Actinomycetota bacterium]